MANRFTGVLTGKGVAFGGNLVRTEATASDSDGFFHDPHGIDAERLAWLKKELKEVRRGRAREYAEHFGWS